ncbi:MULTISPECIES: PTS lactose/cellobiose transporter subunit IIA [unclassified Enterococcus]|uniref:PTS lactose/cellobiose transporter subunit IIA n=1 Tax=unclassified Enterococcus TaxID=2608891 RepID=UPI001CE12462|nr:MULTISPECIES: PTS lactose/cellobiose transporter subunit IIA [unclassified Enterococcus]MCA5011536.1 PTS lactose/cellobiose transporter subunit IIA [Enterococcus sp. S23]MCA5015022.1 PTS lactose/cellobiose transporter subunit IIA [Enterococcus sp. S22(2020)]
MDDLLSEQAMKIILYAGDARVNCRNALVAIEKNDFDTANEEMKLAKSNITQAHQVQTKAIQSEMGEEAEEHPHSLLFTHAQDTLMTIYSEINMANHLIKIAKQIDERLQQLEKQ